MKLSELLTVDRVVVPMRVEDLRSGMRKLARSLVGRDGGLDEADVERVVQEAMEGDAGDLVRVNEAFLLAAVEMSGVTQLTAALGVAPSPFRVDGRSPGGHPTLARGLILLVTPRRLSNLRVQAIPTLVRYFREGKRTRKLLEADGPEAILALEGLDGVEVHDRLVVEDALTPLQYRVYPDTPMDEVVDLMIRRGLHAVPVVGENHEVLGILTGGDALEHLLPRRLGGDRNERGPSPARDVMSRSVLCVSENQPLAEAANMMLNRDVAQLPVVREGQLIGMLTRETVLRQLFGR